MGWMEGLITGFTDRQRELRRENQLQAAANVEREYRLFQSLLNSDDPEIRTMAGLGMMENAQGTTGGSFLQKWMGKQAANPYYSKLLEYMQTPQPVEKETFTPGLASTHRFPTFGTDTLPPVPKESTLMLPDAPNPDQPAALPESSPTQAGAAPMPTPQVVPQPSPAPQPARPRGLGFNTGEGVSSPLAPALPVAPGLFGQGSGPGSSPVVPPQLSTPPPAPPGPAAAAPDAAAPAAASTAEPPPLPGASIGAQAVVAAPPPPPWRSVAAPADPRANRHTHTEYELPKAFRTAEEAAIAAARAKGLGEYESLVEAARRANKPNPEQWAADLLAAEMENRSVGANPYRRQFGEWTDPATGEVKQGFATYSQASGGWTMMDGTPAPTDFRQVQNVGLGTYVEQAAEILFGTRASSAPPERRAEMIQLGEVLRTRANAAGSLGTMRGRFQGEIDIPTAQASGLPVGTTAASIAGQPVPTMANIDDRRQLVTAKNQLAHIRDQLIGVLPLASDLIGGRTPGAVIAYRRRTGATRALMAQLDAAVDGIVNGLARSFGQRGSQTEQDAERAYNTAVQLQGILSDPLRGDTQESATARINETVRFLEAALAELPATPTPAAAPAVAPAAAPATATPATAAPGGVITADTPLPEGLRDTIDPVTGRFRN